MKTETTFTEKFLNSSNFSFWYSEGCQLLLIFVEEIICFRNIMPTYDYESILSCINKEQGRSYNDHASERTEAP